MGPYNDNNNFDEKDKYNVVKLKELIANTIATTLVPSLGRLHTYSWP